MTEPLITTGLAGDWLKRLHQLWATIRETRRDELLDIRNIFGDPELLAQFYVEPDCQPTNPADHHECEPGRAFRQPIRRWLNEFLKGEFFARDGRNTVFVLSDAGMGKSSLLMMLKLTHLLRFWPDGLDFKLIKLAPESLETIAAIRNRGQTVLLLDALDEDPAAWGRIEARLTELLHAVKSFRQVVVTCRTQFFPKGGTAPIEAPFKIEVGGFICNLLYLSPFDDEQVETYLRKVCATNVIDRFRTWITKQEHPRLLRARRVIGPMQSLRMRPMLLAHIDDLMEAGVEDWGEYRLYKALVEHWLLREERKPRSRVSKAQLWDACMVVALHLQRAGKYVLSPADLEALLERQPVAQGIETVHVGGRSLLNRTSDGGFRFSHHSIQEFLVAHRLTVGDGPEIPEPLRATDPLVAFLLSWVAEAPRERFGRLRWRALAYVDLKTRVSDYFRLKGPLPGRGDFQGAYLLGADLRGLDLGGANLRAAHLRAADLRKADLRGADLRAAVLDDADLEDATLTAADLRQAGLAGARLTGARLDRADARGAGFRGADLRHADLRFGRFVGADFRDAQLDGVTSLGAGFLAALGFADGLPATAGPPRPRELRLVPQLGHARAVYTVAWSPDGRVVASGSRDESIRLWDPDGGLLAVLAGHPGTAWSLAWDPAGTRLASGSDAKTIELWDAENGRLRPLEGHASSVLSVAWDPGGDRLASGSDDKTVKIWNPGAPSLLHTLEGHSSRVWSVAWDPRGGRLASGSDDKTVKIWDPEARRLLHSLEGHALRIWSVAWDPGGDRLASGSDDGSVKIWDAAAGQPLTSLEGHTSRVFSVAWDPGGDRLASGSDDKTVKIWDLGTGRMLDSLDHPGAVRAVAWSSAGEQLAAATAAGTVELWELGAEEPRRLPRRHQVPPVRNLVVTADGFVDGPPEALEAVRFADGWALYDLTDVRERHDPERVRAALGAGKPAQRLR